MKQLIMLFLMFPLFNKAMMHDENRLSFVQVRDLYNRVEGGEHKKVLGQLKDGMQYAIEVASYLKVYKKCNEATAHRVADLYQVLGQLKNSFVTNAQEYKISKYDIDRIANYVLQSFADLMHARYDVIEKNFGTCAYIYTGNFEKYVLLMPNRPLAKKTEQRILAISGYLDKLPSYKGSYSQEVVDDQRQKIQECSEAMMDVLIHEMYQPEVNSQRSLLHAQHTIMEKKRGALQRLGKKLLN